jgi:hypothetical protein
MIATTLQIMLFEMKTEIVAIGFTLKTNI